MDFGVKTAGGGAGYSVADVGDVTGAGYDDMLIGAPTVINPSTLGTGQGAAYLVLGSTQVTSSNPTATVTWPLNNSTSSSFTAPDRVGDLAQLGALTPAQTDPVNGATLGFPFSGVTFTATGATNFGASVAGVPLGGSPALNGILIGAPGSNGSTGMAYYVTGNFSQYIGKTVDLSKANPGLNITIFVNTASYAAGGQLGWSVAGGSNILGDGAGDIILGAPKASVAAASPTPVPGGTGVVYLISISNLATGTVDVSTLGGATNSVVFSGVATGDSAGFSVADGGDVNGATGNVDDLLIGAPSASASAGTVYLVYGGSALANAGNQTTANGVTFINLNNVAGGTGTGTTIPGATIVGPASGSTAGFAVSPAADFNDDGFADIMIGAPGFSGSSTTSGQGEVTLLYGAATGNSAELTGRINLGTLTDTSAVQWAQFTGANAGDMAGYAISQVGSVYLGGVVPPPPLPPPTTTADAILIGAPGFNSSAGAAYLIAGRTGLEGAQYSLSNIAMAPLSGLQYTESSPSLPTANFFGAALSSRLQGSQTNTVDTDNASDWIIGAPGLDITQGTQATKYPLSGGAQIVQSGTQVIPVPAVITVPIGVNSANAPFSIPFPFPATIKIFVKAETTTNPPFMPVTDINPAAVTVNGVRFTNITVTEDPNMADWVAGIPTAEFSIPTAPLNLTGGTKVFTVSGTVLATQPLAGNTWTGTATVNVGGPPTPAVTVATAPATGPVLQTTFVPVFGANQYTPSLSDLSQFNYQAIPLAVALNQYLPGPGFRARIYLYNHPYRKIKANRGQNEGWDSDGINTLGPHVFNRSSFHAQKLYTWTHNNHKLGAISGIVPTRFNTQRFKDNLLH
jgi:hypothetical protein